MTCNNIGDAYELIHEGRVPDLGCHMLGRNRPKSLVDNGNLDEGKSSYLISLPESFLPIHQGATFYAESYNPH